MPLNKINKLRKEKGLTLKELAVKSDVPLSTLKKISAGTTTNPKLDTIKALTKALNCTLEDLVPSDVKTIHPQDQSYINKYLSLNGQSKNVINILIEHEYNKSLEAENIK